MRRARGEEERIRKMKGKMNERDPNSCQDSLKSSTLIFSNFLSCSAEKEKKNIRKKKKGRRRARRKPFNDPTVGKLPCTSYVFLLSPMRFHTEANWIIYVSRVGCAVASFKLQSAGDKNGELVHGREMRKKERLGRLSLSG